MSFFVFFGRHDMFMKLLAGRSVRVLRDATGGFERLPELPGQRHGASEVLAVAPHRSRFFASSSIIALIASGVMLVSPRSKVIFSSLPVKGNGAA